MLASVHKDDLEWDLVEDTYRILERPWYHQGAGTCVHAALVWLESPLGQRCE